MIEFMIKTLDSNNHRFLVEDEITVQQLKEKVREQMGIEINLQRLIFCGRVLQDEKKLSEYDVHGKVVHLVQRAPPSPEGRHSDRPTPSATNAATSNPEPNTANMQQQIRRMMTMAGPPDIVLEQQQAMAMSPTPGRLEFIRRMIADIKTSLAMLRAHAAGEENRSAPATSETPLEPMDNEPTTGLAQDESEPQLDENGDEVPDATGRGNNARRRSYRATRALRARNSRPRDLGQLIEELDTLQEQFAPFRATYVRLLRAANNADPPQYSMEDRDSAQRTVDMVSDIMHSFAHAYHAVSDISFQVGLRNPRLTSESTVGRHPMPMQAHINVVQANRRPPLHNANFAAGATGPSTQSVLSTQASATPNASINQSAGPRNPSAPTVNINIQPEPITYQVEIETRVPIAIPLDNNILQGMTAALLGHSEQPQPQQSQTAAAGTTAQNGQASQAQGTATGQSTQTGPDGQSQATRRQVLLDFENLFRGLSQTGGLGGVELVMSMEELPQGGIQGVATAQTGNNYNAAGTGTANTGTATAQATGTTAGTTTRPATGSATGQGAHAATGRPAATGNVPNAALNMRSTTTIIGPSMDESGVFIPMPWAPPTADFMQNIVQTMMRQGFPTDAMSLQFPGAVLNTQPASEYDNFSQRHATTLQQIIQAQFQAQMMGMNPGQMGPQQAGVQVQHAGAQAQHAGAQAQQAGAQAQQAGAQAQQAGAQAQHAGAQAQQAGAQAQQAGAQAQQAGAEAQHAGGQTQQQGAQAQHQSAQPYQSTRPQGPQAQAQGAQAAQDPANPQTRPTQPLLHVRRANAATRAQAMSLANCIYDRFLGCDSSHARRRILRRREQHQQQIAAQERLRADRAASQNIETLRDRNLNLTEPDIQTMVRLLNSAPSDEVWFNALLVTVARHVYLPDPMQPVSGEPQLVPNEFQTLRILLRNYVQALLARSGTVDVDGEDAYVSVADYLIDQHLDFISGLVNISPVHDDIDLLGSIRELARARLPAIAACVTCDAPGEMFAARFYSVFSRLFTDFCALISACFMNGNEGLRLAFRYYVEYMTQTFEPPSRHLMMALGIANVEGVVNNLNNNNISQFIQHRERDDPAQSPPLEAEPPFPMEVSPAPAPREESMQMTPSVNESTQTSASFEPNVEQTAATSHASTSSVASASPTPMHSASSAATQSPSGAHASRINKEKGEPSSPTHNGNRDENMRFVPPLMIVQHWGEEWVPVFTQDQNQQEQQQQQQQQRQQQQQQRQQQHQEQQQREAPEEPYSDAYIGGMPLRKRRCIRTTRPPYNLEGFINDSVREAADNDTSRTVDSTFRIAFREHMRNMARSRASSSEDYDPLRYASTARFLDTTRPSKPQQPDNGSVTKDEE